MSMPEARHPDVGALLPALVMRAGLVVDDAWAEAPAGAGPGPVADYLETLTGCDPGDDPVVLPPLVTVVARVPDADLSLGQRLGNRPRQQASRGLPVTCGHG